MLRIVSLLTVASVVASFTGLKAPVDLLILQDATSGMEDAIEGLSLILPRFHAYLNEVHPGSKIGLATFRDKPEDPLGDPSNDSCLSLVVPLYSDNDLAQSYGSIRVGGGGKTPQESQLTSLIGAADDGGAIGWSSSTSSKKIVLLITDSDPHLAGHAVANTNSPYLPYPPYPIDWESACLKYDYPTFSQVAATLRWHNVSPAILLVPSSSLAHAEDAWTAFLEDALGFPSDRKPLAHCESGDCRDAFPTLVNLVEGLLDCGLENCSSNSQGSPRATEDSSTTPMPYFEVATLASRRGRLDFDDEVLGPIDIMLLMDATTGTEEMRNSLIRALEEFFGIIRERFPGSRVGVASFKDKPFLSMGLPNDYCGNIEQDLTDDFDLIAPALESIKHGGGCNVRQAHYTAFMGIARSGEVSWRRIVKTPTSPDHTMGRFIFVITSTPPAWQGHAQQLFNDPEHPGKTFPPRTELWHGWKDECLIYDYPDPEEIVTALRNNGINLGVVLAPVHGPAAASLRSCWEENLAIDPTFDQDTRDAWRWVVGPEGMGQDVERFYGQCIDPTCPDVQDSLGKFLDSAAIEISQPTLPPYYTDTTQSETTSVTAEPSTAPSSTSTEESTSAPSFTTTEEPLTATTTTATEGSTSAASITTTEESISATTTTATEESTSAPAITTTEESISATTTTATEESTSAPSITTTEESISATTTTATEESTSAPSITTTEESISATTTTATEEAIIATSSTATEATTTAFAADTSTEESSSTGALLESSSDFASESGSTSTTTRSPRVVTILEEGDANIGLIVGASVGGIAAVAIVAAAAGMWGFGGTTPRRVNEEVLIASSN